MKHTLFLAFAATCSAWAIPGQLQKRSCGADACCNAVSDPLLPSALDDCSTFFLTAQYASTSIVYDSVTVGVTRTEFATIFTATKTFTYPAAAEVAAETVTTTTTITGTTTEYLTTILGPIASNAVPTPYSAPCNGEASRFKTACLELAGFAVPSITTTVGLTYTTVADVTTVQYEDYYPLGAPGATTVTFTRTSLVATATATETLISFKLRGGLDSGHLGDYIGFLSNAGRNMPDDYADPAYVDTIDPAEDGIYNLNLQTRELKKEGTEMTALLVDVKDESSEIGFPTFATPESLNAFGRMHGWPGAEYVYPKLNCTLIPVPSEGSTYLSCHAPYERKNLFYLSGSIGSFHLRTFMLQASDTCSMSPFDCTQEFPEAVPYIPV
ncbi:hypothetical protein TWF506_003252 [Arthrobotrys conoides]|uniref:Uncharacterized protein n=1 Tax=Arthrobotrys conoides TaxID=74498 RepID=A0AAN8P7S0_9PEZI